jgi:hypothetical protein
MSLDADVLPLGPVGPFPPYNAECGHEIAFEGDIVVSVYTRTEGRRIGRRLVTPVTA